MKKSTKYLIARLCIMALCVAIGFGIGWMSKETEVVEVNITRPIVRVCEPIEEKELEPTPTYKEMKVVATAYCGENYPHICNDGEPTKTSTGVKPRANHTIAADPKVLPYGTEILCSMGEFVVEDCGGSIKGNRIDFFFDSHEEALQFGRQEFSIWVKEAN